ncbi:MAG: hypothetical protein JWO67_1986 [Streptosporangiaceae bacterium]|jgi:hypothetical protein|nr:hypothetical protein [Streptosporangiaceae bacterium]
MRTACAGRRAPVSRSPVRVAARPGEGSAMRYWGTHRRSRDVKDPAFASSPPDQAREHRATRPRRAQPRDALGRFRKMGRDGGHAVEPVEHRSTWREFELPEDLPHARPHPPDAPLRRDGRRHCGALEDVLYRQWDAQEIPPPDVVRAIDSLATLPEPLKDKLAAGIDGIYVGPGGVPDLDDMGHLKDRPLPSGKATWDICAGAYGDRKIVVGDRPSPTPDVMMHEVGHALDDIDGADSGWQSDSREFRGLYDQCLPHLASDFHLQPNDLGRREFFADAFAAIGARQRPALVDMLGGDIRTALNVMLFFNRRYGM